MYVNTLNLIPRFFVNMSDETKKWQPVFYCTKRIWSEFCCSLCDCGQWLLICFLKLKQCFCNSYFKLFDGQRVSNGQKRPSTVRRMMLRIWSLALFNTIHWSGSARSAHSKWRSTSSLRVLTGTACWDRRQSLYLTCRTRKIQATLTVSSRCLPSTTL